MIAIAMLGFVLGIAPQGAAAPNRTPPPAPAAAQAPDTCDCETQRPDVLATVNGIKIATKDIEADTADAINILNESLDEAREQMLRSQVVNRLVDLEAARRGVTRAKLLQTEVVEKLDEPTDGEVRTFYEKNQTRISGNFDQLKNELVDYIRLQRQQIQFGIMTESLSEAAQIQMIDPSPAAPTTDKDRAKVLATVNGTNITLGEIEDQLVSVKYDYRRRVYAFEKDALDARIDGVLIQQEAARRGVAVQAILDAEVTPKVHKVDAFDAANYYNANKAKFSGQTLAEVKDDLVKYLQDEERVKARHAFAETLKGKANVAVNLVEPAPPTFAIDVAGRPTRGNPSATVTIVEFSDFQCPKCASAYTIAEELLKSYGDKIRFVARNYPLEQHRYAFKAAQAAEAARDQGKYWEYAALLFANQSSLSIEKMKDLATQAGLDRAKFDAALDSGKFASLVERDMTDGDRLGIAGTPAFYVNGRSIADTSAAGLKIAVDDALARGK